MLCGGAGVESQPGQLAHRAQPATDRLRSRKITAKKGAAKQPARNATKESLEDEVQSALKWLKSHSSKATLDGMARYALPADKAFGVAYKDMKVLGKRLGQNHENEHSN